jgi:hypothetical protein
MFINLNYIFHDLVLLLAMLTFVTVNQSLLLSIA